MQAKRQFSEEFKKETIHLLETSGKRLLGYCHRIMTATVNIFIM